MNPTELWEAAMQAIKDKDFAGAEAIAAQTPIKSDARLIRQRAATLCGSSGPKVNEPAAHQSTDSA